MRPGIRLVLVLLFAAVLSFGADLRLSGNWTLDVAHSDFGHATRPVKSTATYTVRGDVVNATQIIYIAGGQQKSEMTWYLDGLRHPSQKPAPGYSVTQWDGHAFVDKRSSTDGLYKETIRVTLSPDGATATETVDSKTPQGTNREKLIWRRAG